MHVKKVFDFLETTLLADGRNWARKTDKPSLADIHGKHLTRITHPQEANLTVDSLLGSGSRTHIRETLPKGLRMDRTFSRCIERFAIEDVQI